MGTVNAVILRRSPVTRMGKKSVFSMVTNWKTYCQLNNNNVNTCSPPQSSLCNEDILRHKERYRHSTRFPVQIESLRY